MKKLTTSPKDSNYDPDTDPTNIAMTKALEKHYAAADAAEEEDEDIDENGNVISWSSAGSKGFKGSRKSTPYAAQVAADEAGGKAYDMGLRTLSVQVKGPGSGRETALRALQSRGFKILSIKDTTPMPHNGTRPPKKRRV